ncbi:MAG: phosphotransferase [Lachnospiraceae bacterium]|nr:phosphotransferase [Lachnospiraceae bacterium]
MKLNNENMISSRETAKVYKVDNMAVKVFKADHPTSEVLNEALNTARVEETGLNIPKIIEISKIDGQWAITTEFIEGKTIAQLMKENPDDVEKYIDMMVDLQLEVNVKRCPLLNRMKEKMIRQIQSVTEINETTKYELLTRLESMPKHIKLCHGDFNPSNIIIGEEKTYILDWVHATQGNASADVARTYLLLALQSTEQADIYLNKFCEKTGTAKQYVQRWLPIVAAAQLTKKRPEEKELLMKWLDVVEYQ